MPLLSRKTHVISAASGADQPMQDQLAVACPLLRIAVPFSMEGMRPKLPRRFLFEGSLDICELASVARTVQAHRQVGVPRMV